MPSVFDSEVDFVSLNATAPDADLEVVLYDQSGRTCSTQLLPGGFNGNDYRLDLSMIEPGTYFVSISNDRVQSSKILIVL